MGRRINHDFWISARILTQAPMFLVPVDRNRVLFGIHDPSIGIFRNAHQIYNQSRIENRYYTQATAPDVSSSPSDFMPMHRGITKTGAAQPFNDCVMLEFVEWGA